MKGGRPKMKLSEKIAALRKANGMTQEEKEGVCEECRRLGITDAEMNWTE